MLVDLALGVAANVLTVVLFFGVGLPYLISKRRRKLKFFGMNSNNPSLIMYLSGVPVDLADRVAEHSKIIRGFKGTLTFRTESEAANIVAAELSNMFVARMPKKLKDYSKETSIKFSRINVSIAISPNVEPHLIGPQLADVNTVCIGSHVYNSVTFHYQNSLGCFFRFEEVEGELQVVRSDARASGEFWRGRSEHRELAIFQRLKNSQRSQTNVIICAGTGQIATKKAVEYMIENWEAYQRAFGEAPFGVCLGFSTSNPESGNASKIEVLEVLPK